MRTNRMLMAKVYDEMKYLTIHPSFSILSYSFLLTWPSNHPSLFPYGQCFPFSNRPLRSSFPSIPPAAHPRCPFHHFSMMGHSLLPAGEAELIVSLSVFRRRRFIVQNGLFAGEKGVNFRDNRQNNDFQFYFAPDL
jgi:hypothetical protein